MRLTIASAFVLFLAVSAHAQQPALSAAACERLGVALRLPDTTVTLAQAVEPGRFDAQEAGAAAARIAPGLPAFCRIALTIRPSSDSDIRSEIWLPTSGWNGKLLHVGNGAWGGSLQYAALADGVRRGYATASTDTGHRGSDASFALGHPEKLVDFAYRAVHETAVQSKTAIQAAYGAPPRYSYFNGCSGGGRQAFMAAQRFPGDFDGIIAGDPNYRRTDGAFQVIGAAQAVHGDGASFIPASKYPAMHRAVMQKCDALDGLSDGLIVDPRKCAFDPAVLACRGGDAADCLTPAQVTAARRIYAPVMDPKTGAEVFPGLEPGSEPGWAATSGERPHPMYHDLFRFVVFQDPDWDFRTLDIREHLERARAIDRSIPLSPTSPDLEPFVQRGGRLIIYHGWADPNISPRASIDYFDQLTQAMGKADVDKAVRLYMVPGMGHCGGGNAPNEFDMIAVLEQWREHGRAPAEVIASQTVDGRVTRTRPLCPYPQVARYKGTGSADRAESFACTEP